MSNTLWPIAVPGDLVAPALDFDTAEEAEAALDQLDDCPLGAAKVGHRLANSIGQEEAYAIVKQRGRRLFADVKFFDIPETVAEASRVLVERHGVDLFNVCAAAGVNVLEAAVANAGSAIVIVMGVPSSMTDDMCRHTYGMPVLDKQIEFVDDTIAVGAPAMVCSAANVAELSEYAGDKVVFITPAIRLPGDDARDQVNPQTPDGAVRGGSGLLVMGSSLVKPKDGNIRGAYDTTCDLLSSLVGV